MNYQKATEVPLGVDVRRPRHAVALELVCTHSCGIYHQY